MQDSWISRFKGLSSLKEPIRKILEARATVISVDRGTVLFGPGKAPEHLIFLLEGTVRVQQCAESGREIVLYRVHAGESCVLTTACLLAYEDYTAEGLAETDIRAAALPRLVFDDLIAQSKEFRSFVFSAYSRRITDLFHVIDEVAFQRMDIRLAQKLVVLGQGGRVQATHQQLAAELGTAREVVSRQLQEFQRRDWIRQSRGVIEILNAPAVSALASAEAA